MLNDLWKFNGNLWTWMSGSDEKGQNGNYGELGIPDHSNEPPCRSAASSWTDINGNLWLFGGQQSGKCRVSFLYKECIGAIRMNDLWIYNGGNWTWMSGDSSINQYSSYGDKGVASTSNVPGARHSAISWRDNDGNLWIFGGHGFGESSPGAGGSSNCNVELE
jgi:hypothetical protein